MFRDIVRRLTASALAGGLVLMAWSACASGAMTMSEMVCCAEHHDGCEMVGMAESCCGTDQHADIGMLKPERADDAPALTTCPSVLTNVHFPFRSSLQAGSGVEPGGPFRDARTSSHLAHTVLLL